MLQSTFQLSPAFLFTFFLSKQPSEVFGFVVVVDVVVVVFGVVFVGFGSTIIVGFVGVGSIMVEASTPAQSLLPDTTFLSALEYPNPDMVQQPYDQ